LLACFLSSFFFQLQSFLDSPSASSAFRPFDHAHTLRNSFSASFLALPRSMYLLLHRNIPCASCAEHDPELVSFFFCCHVMILSCRCGHWAHWRNGGNLSESSVSKWIPRGTLVSLFPQLTSAFVSNDNNSWKRTRFFLWETNQPKVQALNLSVRSSRVLNIGAVVSRYLICWDSKTPAVPLSFSLESLSIRLCSL
jgi:hypothetical protein